METNGEGQKTVITIDFYLFVTAGQKKRGKTNGFPIFSLPQGEISRLRCHTETEPHPEKKMFTFVPPLA